MFLYSLPVHIEYFYKKTKYIAVGTAGAAVVNLVLNYIAISLWDYQGAAWATLLSYVLLFIFHWDIARKINRAKMFPIRFMIGSILVQCLFSIWILACIDNWIVRWCSFVLMLSTIFLIFRKEINLVLEMIPFIKLRRK